MKCGLFIMQQMFTVNNKLTSPEISVLEIA